MAVSLRPQHFLSREDGSLTALVAIDELPPFISIRGIPRTLSHSDTQGMTSLGTVNSRGQYYLIDNQAQTAPHHNGKVASDGFELTPSAPKHTNSDDDCHSRHNTHRGWNIETQTYDAQPWKNAGFNGQDVVKYSHAPRSGKGSHGSNSTKKEFCSFWLRRGECDYQQQGCIFKHEMPTDRATLEKLGLRDIPRWYRERNGIKGTSAASGGGGGGGSRTRSENGRAWRDGGQQQPTTQEERYGAQPARLMMSGASEDPTGFAGMLSQYSPDINVPDGQSMYRPSSRLPDSVVTTASTSTSGSANAAPTMPAESRATDVRGPNRFDLLTVDEFREYASATAAPSNALRAHDSFRGMSGHQGPHGRSGQVDYLTSTGVDTPSLHPNTNGHATKDTKINIVPSYTRNNVPTPLISPVSNSLWTLRENLEEDLSVHALSSFQSVGATPGHQSLAQEPPNSKKRQQRSRRLYQPRNIGDETGSNNGTTVAENAGEDNVWFRPFKVAPVITTPYPLDPSAVISPSFSPLPFGSYPSSTICSPHTTTATSGRLSSVTDKPDLRRTISDSYAMYQPDAVHSELYEISGDLFNLNVNQGKRPQPSRA